MDAFPTSGAVMAAKVTDALVANFDAVIALVAILSVVIEPVAIVCSPTTITHAVPLYFHVVVPTVYWSLLDGELGKSIAIMQSPNFLKM